MTSNHAPRGATHSPNRRRTSPAARFIRTVQDPQPAAGAGISVPPALAKHLRQLADTLEREPQVRLIATPNERYHALVKTILELQELLERMTPEQNARGVRLAHLLKAVAIAIELSPDDPLEFLFTSDAPKGTGVEMTPEEFSDVMLLLDRIGT